MYQDDPEVKVALIRAAQYLSTFQLETEVTPGSPGIDADTRDTAREYLRSMMGSTYDDTEDNDLPEDDDAQDEG